MPVTMLGAGSRRQRRALLSWISYNQINKEDIVTRVMLEIKQLISLKVNGGRAVLCWNMFNNQLSWGGGMP